MPAADDAATSFQSAVELVTALRMRDVRRAFQLMTASSEGQAANADVLLVPFGLTCGEFAVAHVLCRQ
tara:strand:+ start:315 stop:518 length:204 start_codon:yes stop_codon:yes gene_type:complete